MEMIPIPKISIIEILRSIKDISNPFLLVEGLSLIEDIAIPFYIKPMNWFIDDIKKYHISCGQDKNTIYLYFVIISKHIFIDKDKNIFIYEFRSNKITTSLHLIPNEIYNDDLELCLKHGRILFEDI